MFLLLQDTIPEPAERYSLRLLPGTVSGGARAEGILAGELIIEDSDDAYGVIQFTAASAQMLLTVRSSPKAYNSMHNSISNIHLFNVQFHQLYTPIPCTVLSITCTLNAQFNQLYTSDNTARLMFHKTSNRWQVGLVAYTSLIGIFFNFLSWYFHVLQSTSPRRLMLSLARTGGNLGNILVTYDVLYFPSSGTAAAKGAYRRQLPDIDIKAL